MNTPHRQETLGATRRERLAQIDRALGCEDSIPREAPDAEALDVVMRALDTERSASRERVSRPMVFRMWRPLAAAAAIGLVVTAGVFMFRAGSSTPPLVPAADSHAIAKGAVSDDAPESPTPAVLLSRTMQELRDGPRTAVFSAFTRPLRNETRGLAHQTALGARFLIAKLPAVPWGKE